MADEQTPESASSAEPVVAAGANQQTEPLAVSAPTPGAPAHPTASLPSAEEPATAPPSAPATPSGAARVWRAVDQGPRAKPWHVVSIVLLILGCVIAPIGVTASWAKNLVVNQDAYLAAVEPLITDPVIISAAEVRLVAGIDDAISNLQLADKIGDELTSLGLPPKLATLATGYLATFRADITQAITNMVDELLNSPKLATIWNDANAKAHTAFVKVMQGEDPTKLHSINVDLSSAVAAVKAKLVSSGVSWASNIPDVPVVFNLAGNADVQMVSGYYDLLNTLGTWLPILAVVLLLLSILIAPSRLGGLAKAAGWLAVSMVVLTVLLIIGRQWLISESPLQPQVTQAFARQLTVGLQGTIRLILVVAAVIAVVAWLFGRSRSAVGLRREVSALTGQVLDSRWHLAVRVIGAVVAVALLLVLLNMENPSVLWAILLAILAGLGAVVAVSPQRDAEPAAAGVHAEVPNADRVGVSS